MRLDFKISELLLSAALATGAACVSVPLWAQTSFGASGASGASATTVASVPPIDTAEVCKRFEGQRAYTEGSKTVLITCDMVKQQYASIVRYLNNSHKPVFSNLQEMLNRVGERDFYSVFRKKDVESCEAQKLSPAQLKNQKYTQAQACVLGDMNWVFYLNDHNQLIQAECHMGIGSRMYQDVYDQYFGKFKHANTTLNYNLLVADLFAKASPSVDGPLIKTAFVDNAFVLVFLNPTFH